jgi:hypothetical protein
MTQEEQKELRPRGALVFLLAGWAAALLLMVRASVSLFGSGASSFSLIPDGPAGRWPSG